MSSVCPQCELWLYALSNFFGDLYLAGLPNRPGTPEIPQKYKDTALVVWRPSDNLAPCTYSLERKAERESAPQKY